MRMRYVVAVGAAMMAVGVIGFLSSNDLTPASSTHTIPVSTSVPAHAEVPPPR